MPFFDIYGGSGGAETILTSKYSGSTSSVSKMVDFGPPRVEKLIFSDKTLSSLIDCSPKHMHKPFRFDKSAIKKKKKLQKFSLGVHVKNCLALASIHSQLNFTYKCAKLYRDCDQILKMRSSSGFPFIKNSLISNSCLRCSQRLFLLLYFLRCEY